MSADLDGLRSLLELETEPLLALVSSLDEATMATPTPAAGWTVRDQIAHLAYFDEAATASLRDDGSFAPYLEEAASLGAAYVDEVARRERTRGADEVVAWWRSTRGALLAALPAVDPSVRVAWFGPSMSSASMATARTMETWAHGQDVYDALGLGHPVTAALRDVAFLCARTRANSYAARGLAAPGGDVAVELLAPDGATWRFGVGTSGTIRGDAVEFCLVATQRRHVDDTSLAADSSAATEWLGIAQAFAGPGGPGRTPTVARA